MMLNIIFYFIVRRNIFTGYTNFSMDAVWRRGLPLKIQLKRGPGQSLLEHSRHLSGCLPVKEG